MWELELELELVRVTAPERAPAPELVRVRVRVRVLVLAERGRLSVPSAIVRFAPATLQSLPSSSAIPATNCLEAAGAFCDSTFATPIRFHDENDPPVRLDVARADCARRDVIRRREARGPRKQKSSVLGRLLVQWRGTALAYKRLVPAEMVWPRAPARRRDE